MMLVEEGQIPEAVLPVDALKRHLRLGTGFGEDDLQDAVLASFLRAALAAIEARTGKALVRRTFLLTLDAWRDPAGQSLQIAPVESIVQVALVDRTGAATILTADRYRLQADSQQPMLRPTGALLPTIPGGGRAEIRFDAGFAADFGGLPADLAQAVLMLAAHYYEFRHETALGEGCMPFGVTSLISRYRPLRAGFTG
ncbi:head-tail connector protein [Thalassococcus sp. CAU 1522]|uniref:Head-tail connector protein n=1 Tax=Thalassococcus arenae TaxID=2851652 RepID=A0ABS6NCM9_9RHOB|nr:head-tail connector protein [Thalassococcus arenae]MBV2361329.1 head-tail connector protein [Thalassococcus arenae]